MTTAMLVSSIAAELLAAVAVAVSLLYPRRRIWPPDAGSSWKKAWMGFLFLYASAGIGMLGLLDSGSLDLPLIWRLIAGIPLLSGGLSLFLWAAGILGIRRTFGASGLLATAGPFRFSRNPQYIGCMAMLAGWTILSASQAAGLAAGFGFLPLLMVPWAEESWMKARFGRPYEDYLRRVRRFL
ncbi:MAG: isoprenylcysteine carboxylmethyltransferase family protein [Anaerolineales bacterium]|nr:isoprenylcysteine carboxylmethyltransferase family protein [Anaerolineales bacterium]